MNKDQIIADILTWMQTMEIGSGDLTTESVAPYALHTRGFVRTGSDGLFFGRRIIGMLFGDAGSQLNINWAVEELQAVTAGQELFAFEGNGALVLNRQRLIDWIIGRLSGVAGLVRKTADSLNQHGKLLIAGNWVSPVFEALDREAFEAGGGQFGHHGLEDRLYIRPLHIAYAGIQLPEVVARVNSELGPARKAIKIEIEVNNWEQFMIANRCDADVIHLVGLAPEEIDQVFQKGDPRLKPVLHLETLDDFRAHYADYYFRYCAIENLPLCIKPLKTEVIIQ